jgi:hypothetical protein
MAPLQSAVAASCAVPGYFAPVDINGEHHVDGGLRSATNADLVACYEGELDLVIISSPMSGEGLGRLGPEAWMRRFSARRLDQEIINLRKTEIPTVVLQPGAEGRDAMGINLMDHRRMRAVVGSSFLDVGAQLQARRTRALVAGLSATAAPSVRWVGTIPMTLRTRVTQERCGPLRATRRCQVTTPTPAATRPGTEMPATVGPDLLEDGFDLVGEVTEQVLPAPSGSPDASGPAPG